MATGLREAGEFDLTMDRAAKEAGLSLTEFYARVTQSVELAKKLLAMALSVVFRLVVDIDRDMTGWKCIDPVVAMDGEFEPVLQEFLRDGDNGCVGGEKMVKRAKEMGVLTGLRHAEAMLREQEKIPVEWRKHVLVFAEVWQSSYGIRYVWCLYWRDGRWYLHCSWLDYVFDSIFRLVSARKYQR